MYLYVVSQFIFPINGAVLLIFTCLIICLVLLLYFTWHPIVQINLTEGVFSNLAVVGRFLDIDHLTSMCVQLPKQETVKTAESKITTVIYLKHTLELVEPLRLALKDAEAELFKAYYEVLED